ncbi:hypothetical protein, partial [Geothermobacter hydrogeniphilus]
MGTIEVVGNMGALAEDVYSEDLFTGDRNKTIVPGYQVKAFSQPSKNGFQALLLENVDLDNTAGSKYVFAFRGTEVSFSTPVETWRDLIQTDVLDMGLKNVPAQFLEAILFGEEGDAQVIIPFSRCSSMAYFPHAK